MTRKLHNTLMAVITSSSLLVAGILASAPAAPEFVMTGTTPALVSLDTQVQSTANVIEKTEAASTGQARAVKHRRQSLAMPFFSFAPRS